MIPSEATKTRQFFQINLGHVLTIVSILSGAFWASNNVVSHIISELAAHSTRLDANDRQMAAVVRHQEEDLAQRRVWEGQTTQVLSVLQADVGFLKGRMFNNQTPLQRGGFP